MRKFWFFKIAFFIAAALLVFGFATMFLWNSLIPDLFHGPVLTFWQALGLVVLSKILFHGIGRRGGHHWGHQQWRSRWKEKWDMATPEQREEWRKKWEGRCGGKWKFPGEEQKATTV